MTDSRKELQAALTSIAEAQRHLLLAEDCLIAAGLHNSAANLVHDVRDVVNTMHWHMDRIEEQLESEDGTDH